MNEVITVCENVCRDFSWLVPLFGFLADVGTFAVGGTVIVAVLQLRAWRREAHDKKVAEIAQECLAVVYDVDHALRGLRLSQGIPLKSTFSSELREKQKKLIGLESGGLFRELRVSQVQTQIFIDDADTHRALEEFFSIKDEISQAIDTYRENALGGIGFSDPSRSC